MLRDASAASIYGSRAANGVIIVTTKKEKRKINVDFSSYLTLSKYTSKIDVLGSKDYAKALWKASINSGINPNSNNLGIIYRRIRGPRNEN